MSVKERPIIFSAMMVEAILDGKKTQTRRVVKIPGKYCGEREDQNPGAICQDGGGNWIAWYPGNSEGLPELTKKLYPNGEGFKCPYGKAGDRLWVRETWYDNMAGRAEGDHTIIDAQGNVYVVYRADGEFDDLFAEVEGDPKWSPAIFMPRWASRILLEIVSVRVERLQALTPADAVAEGCPHPPDDFWTEHDAVCWYGNLWDVIHGRGSWCANPWVCVVEFKRAKGDSDDVTTPTYL